MYASSNAHEDFLVLHGSGLLLKRKSETKQWDLVSQDHRRFKSISACKHSCWAVSQDGRVYLIVYPKPSPIRQKVETYENERRLIFTSFSSSYLFPTDRSNFSDSTGSNSQPKQSFILPSKNWEWLDDWFVVNELDGQPLGKNEFAIIQANPFFSHLQGQKAGLMLSIFRILTLQNIQCLHLCVVENGFVLCSMPM